MLLFNSLQKLGSYVLLMHRAFSIPDRWSAFFSRFFEEVYKLVINSIWIVITISLFIGAVITIQMTININSALIPPYTTGLATRDTLLLEFSSSIMCLILAGKVGSNISSEIGTMRVTEQIDALEIMGINSANFLILPKITALVIFIPLLVILSMFTGIIGGYLVSMLTDIVPVSKYVYGIQALFIEYYIWYSIQKSLFFAFIISSVASFHGYTVKGGALEVGKSSTEAVVISSILILMFDVVLTKLLLQ